MDGVQAALQFVASPQESGSSCAAASTSQHANIESEECVCQTRIDVVPTEARARGGVGLSWGCTVKPLVGDTLHAMQPQVCLTSGLAHTRANPR